MGFLLALPVSESRYQPPQQSTQSSGGTLGVTAVRGGGYLGLYTMTSISDTLSAERKMSSQRFFPRDQASSPCGHGQLGNRFWNIHTIISLYELLVAICISLNLNHIMVAYAGCMNSLSFT